MCLAVPIFFTTVTVSVVPVVPSILAIELPYALFKNVSDNIFHLREFLSNCLELIASNWLVACLQGLDRTHISLHSNFDFLVTLSENPISIRRT